MIKLDLSRAALSLGVTSESKFVAASEGEISLMILSRCCSTLRRGFLLFLILNISLGFNLSMLFFTLLFQSLSINELSSNWLGLESIYVENILNSPISQRSGLPSSDTFYYSCFSEFSADRFSYFTLDLLSLVSWFYYWKGSEDIKMLSGSKL